jgi:hypothetical protein
MGLADIPWQEMSSHGCLRWLFFQRSVMRYERIGLGVKDRLDVPGITRGRGWTCRSGLPALF